MENITIPITEYKELLRYKNIVKMVEEEIHERPFKDEFVKKTQEIRKDMDEGKKIRLKSVDDMDEHMK